MGKPPDKRPRNRGQKPEGIGRGRNRGQSAPYGTPHTGGTRHNGGDTSCCPMVAGVKAISRGNFRLGRRYLAWSLRLIAEKATA